MMSMLLHIGAGLEEESLISDMLDLNVVQHKPQYDMALDFPLVFSSAEFDKELDWKQDSLDSDAKDKLIRHVMQRVHLYKSQARTAQDLLNIIGPSGGGTSGDRPPQPAWPPSADQ